LDPSDSYFLFADFVDFSTHWTYMLIFGRIFLSNYWWQKSDIWSQASYRYPISWEAFFNPSDSYFLFAKERGYHRWALAHSSSCFKTDELLYALFFYIVCKCLSSIIYYGLYMHKVDGCLFQSSLSINQNRCIKVKCHHVYLHVYVGNVIWKLLKLI
jgi:hypothetical protein